METIEVYDNIVYKPREKDKAVPKPVVNACEHYSNAHKAVYGIPPQMEWDGTYVRIMGQPQGVTLKRLREMTNQLRWRAG